MLWSERGFSRIDPCKIWLSDRHYGVRCSASSCQAISASHSTCEVFHDVTLATIVSGVRSAHGPPPDNPLMQVMVTSCPGHTSSNSGASWSVQVIVILY